MASRRQLTSPNLTNRQHQYFIDDSIEQSEVRETPAKERNCK